MPARILCAAAIGHGRATWGRPYKAFAFQFGIRIKQRLAGQHFFRQAVLFQFVPLSPCCASCTASDSSRRPCAGFPDKWARISLLLHKLLYYEILYYEILNHDIVFYDEARGGHRSHNVVRILPISVFNLPKIIVPDFRNEPRVRHSHILHCL